MKVKNEKGETIFMVPRHVCPTVNLHECINLLSYDDDARNNNIDEYCNYLKILYLPLSARWKCLINGSLYKLCRLG